MIEKYLIAEESTVKQAIEVMESNLIKAVIVVDESKRVKGLFSNGDMRAFFLKGGELSASVTKAMNSNPRLYRDVKEVEDERRQRIRVIYPIVDDEKRVLDVIDYNQEIDRDKVVDTLKEVPVVIMAGGKGTRLYPFTQILPKPLIPIGDYTITERIIEKFSRYGCKDFYMILNYKASMIRAYMNELEKDYSLRYLQEKEFLGTAGGLKLLKGIVQTTFFVSNCDIIVDADLECIYDTHKKSGNKITFVCSMKDMVIPYGVIETSEDGFVSRIKEKPGMSFLVNTGLYMIEPEVLDDIEDGEYIHLPDLAQKYIDRGEKVGVFPISEKSWMDMGQFSEMESMMQQLGIKN